MPTYDSIEIERLNKELNNARRAIKNKDKANETIVRNLRTIISLLQDDILDPIDRIEMAIKDVAHIGLLLKKMTTGITWDMAIGKYGEKAVEKGQEALQDMMDAFNLNTGHGGKLGGPSPNIKRHHDAIKYPF